MIAVLVICLWVQLRLLEQLSATYLRSPRHAHLHGDHFEAIVCSATEQGIYITSQKIHVPFVLYTQETSLGNGPNAATGMWLGIEACQ